MVLAKFEAFLVLSDFFLWGGFVFTLLWHGISWLVFRDLYHSDSDTEVQLAVTNVGLSGVALCCFGYLAFNTL